MRRNGVLMIALVAALCVGCRGDDRRTETGAVGTAGAASDKVSRGDKDFVHDAAIAGMAEVELGKIVSERATEPEVKKFGQMMVSDHTEGGIKLKAIATENTIEWPAQLDDKHRDKIDDLGKKQGVEFDRDYIAAMVDGHEDMIDKLESRIDKKNLAEWKTQMADRPAGKEVKEQGKVIAILPEKSDDLVTMRINEWAASVYPTAYAHLQKAKQIDSDLKRKHTMP